MQRIKFILSHFSAALYSLLGWELPLKSVYRHGKRIRLRQVRPGDLFGVYAEADFYRVVSWPSFSLSQSCWGVTVTDAVEP
jgi:hypothetical protein